jgi:hypothetical protein
MGGVKFPTGNRQRPWGRPERILGSPLSINFLLAQSDNAAVQVQHLTAFPTGSEFQVVAYAVLTEEVEVWDPMFGLAGLRGRAGKDPYDLADDVLRLSVAFSDGTRAHNLRPPMDPCPGETRYLEPGRGGAVRSEDGTLWTTDSTFWVWPLPSPGEVTFVCEWPKFGIEETRHAIDAQLILDATKFATPILPKKPGEPPFRQAY